MAAGHGREVRSGMKRTSPALSFLSVLVLAVTVAAAFAQDVPIEARRHFEAGGAAVEAAKSPAGYLAAIREFEQAAKLAPGWPGAVRALGMVERAAGRFGDAARSFQRYLKLAPGAADAPRIQALAEEMTRAEELRAGVSRVIEGMASGRYVRKMVEKSVLSGEPLMWPGGLDRFRLADGALQVENPWYPGDHYHPDRHPRLPREWEPVVVSEGAYSYAYAHYMDATNGYVVRFDYHVAGEVVSVRPPRVKETIEWETPWGAPLEGNSEPWSGQLVARGVLEYVYELVPAPANGPNALVATPDASKARDAYGRTKLHLAAIEGRRDVAGALVAAGADVNARDNSGATPLHAAAGFGQMAVVDLLLSLGANREAKNNAGDTPLFTAAYWGHLAVVEFLIELGADVNARNMEGLTPLAVAEKQNHTEVATLLKSHGAK
jgi:hypothetical protein